MRIVSEEGRPNSVRIEDSFLIQDMVTGKTVWEYVLHADVNPANGQYLATDYQGQYLVFPRHVEKKTYILRANYLTGVPMAFQREVDVEGLPTYLFSYFGRGEYTDSYFGTQQFPGTRVLEQQEIKCDQDKFSFQVWVEPLTGAIIKLEEGCVTGDYIFDRATGEKLAAVSRWAGSTAGDDVLARADLIRAERARILWIETNIPLILLWLGIICLLMGGLAHLYDRRRKRFEQIFENANKPKRFISLAILNLLWQSVGFAVTTLAAILLLNTIISAEINQNAVALGSSSVEMLVNLIQEDPDLLVASNNSNWLQAAIDNFSKNIPTFQRISVVNAHLQVIADIDHTLVGKISDQNNLIHIMQDSGNTSEPFYYSKNGQDFLRLSHNILRDESVASRKNVIGAVSLDLPLAAAGPRIWRMFTYSRGILVIIMLLHLALQYLFFFRSFLVPVKDLQKAVERINDGELFTPVQVHDNNELGAIQKKFNLMGKKIENTSVALREKSQTLHTIIQSSQLAIIQMDTNRIVKIWNPAAEKIFGWSEAEALELPLRTIPPEKLGEMAALYASLEAGDQLLSVITEQIRKDGTRLIVNLSAAALFDVNGKISGFSSIISDISEIKKIEDAMVESNEALSITIEKLEHRTRELSLMGEMVDYLQVCTSLDEAHSVISKALGKIFPAMSGTLFEIPASRQRMQPVVSWGITKISPATFAMDGCWALRRSRIYHFENIDSGIICEHVRVVREEVAPYLCIPTSAHGDVIGVLHLICNHKNQSISSETRSLAVTIAEQIGLALSNLKLRDVLRQQSIRDALTGLFNRRYLDETLFREIERAKRGSTSLGVIMCDIDHFKNFNDTFGHEAGDLVMKAIGRVLLAGVRADDLACRYGGEEFTIILPGASLSATIKRAEALLTRIRTIKLTYEGKALDSISMSMGIAMYPDNGENNQALLRSADAALFRAKHNGRDRVETAE